MLVTSGKHKGKPLEVVALKDPCFIQGVLLSEAESKAQKAMQAEARRLVDVFDRMPFVVRCCGHGCERRAMRCSIYKSDVLNPWWWCDACDPRQYGAGECKVHIVRTYHDALDFSAQFDDPSVAMDLVRAMAEAKGAPSSPSRRQADVFFNA